MSENTTQRSTKNSTVDPLLSGETFTGYWEYCANFNSIVLSVKTDGPGALYLDMKSDPNQSEPDSTMTYYISADRDESHRVVVTRSFYRIRYVNNGIDQTYLSLESILGTHSPLSSPANFNVGADSDAIVTRPLPFDLDIGLGKIDGYSLTAKMGRNTDIDTATVPEDVITAGGSYTGFPTTAPEEFQVFSSSASDTGTLTFQYLSSEDAESYQSASVTLSGTTAVNTGITGHRAHTMRYSTPSGSGFNVGTITLRWRTTTSVIFLTIAPGRSQSNYCVYTIPAKHTGKITRLKGSIRKGKTAAVDGSLWIRIQGESPHYRRPFTINNSDRFLEEVDSGVTIPPKADIKLTVTSSTANDVEIVAGFDVYTIRTDFSND